jgi:hypothetical protein
LYMGRVLWIEDRPLSLLLFQTFIVKLTPYLMCTLKSGHGELLMLGFAKGTPGRQIGRIQGN